MQRTQVKSALRAIEVLELFGRVRRPQSMSDVAQALGYPVSSTTVLLKTLIGLGYLSFDRHTRHCFPTPKVALLGDWISQELFGSGQILDAMRDVHAATGETTSINTATDIHIQYLQIIQSVDPLRFRGCRTPCTRRLLVPLTAAVRALLTHETRRRRRGRGHRPTTADHLRPAGRGWPAFWSPLASISLSD